MAEESRPRHAWTTVAFLGPYAALNLAFPGPVLAYGGGLLIAVAALATCLRGRLAKSELLLVPGRPSRASLSLFAASAVVVFPALALAHRLVESIELSFVAAAVVSAVGQELYFRGAFLGALRFRFGLAPWRAALLQAAAFAAWHARAYVEVSPELATVVVGLTFLAGLGSALLAIRDGTLVWVAAAHATFLVFI